MGARFPESGGGFLSAFGAMSAPRVHLSADGFQMVRIDTSTMKALTSAITLGGIVASVVNGHAFRDRSNEKFIGDAMRAPFIERSISAFPYRSSPQPASVFVNNQVPQKPFHQSTALAWHMRNYTAELEATVSFSYNSCDGTQDTIDFVRLLVSDTVAVNHIFEDSEITGAYRIQAAQFQSGQGYSQLQGANLPSSPVSYLRVAALLLDAVASNKARLSSVIGLLDVKLNPALAQKALRDQAAAYRATDDDAGAFAIIEQVRNSFTLQDRFFSQVQRQSV
jgi:hypothetical protein